MILIVFVGDQSKKITEFLFNLDGILLAIDRLLSSMAKV
jgi:hypothetical protein